MSTRSVGNIFGRISVSRDDDIVYPDGGSRRDYTVVLRFEGKKFYSSLGCALGEGAVEDIELTESEQVFLDKFDQVYGDLPIDPGSGYTRPAGR